MKKYSGKVILLGMLAMHIVGIQNSAFAAGSSLLIESLRKPKAVVMPISPPTELITTFSDWQISCPNPELDIAQLIICTMKPTAATAYELDQKIKIYGRMIPVQGKKVPVFIIQTGLDLLLPAGISLKIDNRAAIKLAYRSCHADGCIIPFQMSGQIKTAMQNGNWLNIQVTTLDAKSQQLNISLKGFTAALKQLVK